MRQELMMTMLKSTIHTKTFSIDFILEFRIKFRILSIAKGRFTIL